MTVKPSAELFMYQQHPVVGPLFRLDDATAEKAEGSRRSGLEGNASGRNRLYK